MKKNKKAAIRLRMDGKTYNEITKLLKISKSTLSYWFRDDKFKKIKEKIYTLSQKKWSKNIIFYNKIRAKEIWEKREETRNNFSKNIGIIDNRELLLIGTTLYWAEGYKKTKWCISFCNSDPYIIKIMMKFFRSICHVPEKKFKLRLHIHPNITEKKTKIFWSKVTKLPITQFNKTQVTVSSASKHKSKHKRLPNTLPYGTLHILIFDKIQVDKIKGWIAGLEKIC